MSLNLSHSTLGTEYWAMPYPSDFGRTIMHIALPENPYRRNIVLPSSLTDNR
jgi:hypothetical protein